MKKITLFACLLVLLCFNIYASPELWIGGGMTSGRDTVSDVFVSSLKNNPQLMENGIYGSGDLDYISTLGPYYEIVIIPYSPVKIGLYGAGSTSFILGIDGNGYKSYNWDRRQNVSLGLTYNQFFGGSTGFFIDVGFDYIWYSIAGNNAKNSKNEIEFSHAEEKAFSSALGCVVRNESSYFKIGFDFFKPLGDGTESGWALDMFAGGGVCF